MPYQYYLPTSQFAGFPPHGLLGPLSLHHYQNALYNLLNTTRGVGLEEFPELAQKLIKHPCNQLAFINWQADELNSAFLTADTDEALINNIHRAFAESTRLELLLHKILTIWLNRRYLWSQNQEDWLPAWQKIYTELLSLLSDIKHIHCHLTRLLCHHPDLPVWAESSNQIKIEKRPNWIKEYIYQEATYSGFELRVIFNYFMKYCEFDPAATKLENSFFFQSQILKLLSRPIGIELIRKINRCLQAHNTICITTSSIQERDKEYSATSDVYNFNGLFKTGSEGYKLFPGHPAKNVIIKLPFSTFDSPAAYFDTAVYCGVEDETIFSHGVLLLSGFTDFISIAHELRHLLNRLKGKRAPTHPIPPQWQHILKLFSSFEEYRTICYSSCCEQALLADFGLPIRICHEEADNFSEAITMLKTSKIYNLLKLTQLQPKFIIKPLEELSPAGPHKPTPQILSVQQNSNIMPNAIPTKVSIGSGGAFKRTGAITAST